MVNVCTLWGDVEKDDKHRYSHNEHWINHLLIAAAINENYIFLTFIMRHVQKSIEWDIMRHLFKNEGRGSLCARQLPLTGEKTHILKS